MANNGGEDDQSNDAGRELEDLCKAVEEQRDQMREQLHEIHMMIAGLNLNANNRHPKDIDEDKSNNTTDGNDIYDGAEFAEERERVNLIVEPEIDEDKSNKETEDVVFSGDSKDVIGGEQEELFARSIAVARLQKQLPTIVKAAQSHNQTHTKVSNIEVVDSDAIKSS
ncbi:hypothetical protein QJS10_CPB14g01003 [Acorus calamus]|uniref:Uncharacterized protein n=1 Tax=Acorus calamus TaxID=4465 RepID=A0AAV9DCV8_ACOCL|nr:hypothetical protein QJS10_CPB14g01003 [Acorus calamus]